MDGTEGWAVRVPAGYRVGDWEVTGAIATGSWGSVYEGHWTGVRPPPGGAAERVALKFLPTGTVTPRQLRHLEETAEREARAYQELAHVRLLRAHGTLTVDDPGHPELDGAVVLVMERATTSLADLLARHRDDPPVPAAPQLIEQICEGLAHMHAAGWVHGDLKPSNVLVMADGSVRLADFGLAAQLDGTHGYLPPAGSPDYVPPERWSEPLGERGIAIRATADIWALGVTASELLTGRLPFPGSSARARASAVAEYAAGGQPLVLPADLPPAWRSIVADCLAPAHGTRLRHDAQALLERIRRAIEDPAAAAAEDPTAFGAEEPVRPGAGGRRRPRLGLRSGAAATAVAAALAVAAFVLPGMGDEPGTAETRPDLLRTGVGIPAEYRQLIVEAGTKCKDPGLSPALVAAMLKAESNFDPNLSDPAKDEYGIARWTPSVLAWHIRPGGKPAEVPVPPLSPEDSIPAVGNYLCFIGGRLNEDLTDARPLLLAASYRTSVAKVNKAKGISVANPGYIAAVSRYLREYSPR